MNKYSTLFVFICLLFPKLSLIAQSLTGDELLTKSIHYHDVNGKWDSWNPNFTLELELQDRPNRISKVMFDNKQASFHLKVQRDSHLIERIIEKGMCKTLLDGKMTNDSSRIKKYRLTCERTEMYRNYYTYLYGLPMKLRDEGTIIHEKVEKAELNGISYWRMKVTYEESVGDDIWYFYFDEKSYALKAYQFYHDEAKNDGEYILLEGEVVLDGITIPKDRTWYYNKNNKLLGTDFLR
ncbi:MAG: DUF6503 family protein [Bacteroidota bacterium]